MNYRRTLLKPIRALYLLVAILSSTTALHAQDIKWQVDNTVYSSVMLGNTLYLGGSFTYIGKYTGTAVIIPEATGNMPDPSAPKLNVTGLLPSISCIIPDGSNGYFVAGSVSYVDGSSFSPTGHILYIKPDAWGNKNVQWAARTSGRVNCIYMLGSTLYVGGVFSSVTGASGTQTRRNIAAINIADGAVTTWNPGFGATGTGVFGITGAGSVVYVGGGFTFGSFTNLAAINTGVASSAWTVPNNPNNTVRVLAITGTKLLVGGDFTVGGTLARRAVAAVNKSDGTTIAGFDAGSSAPGGTNAIRSFVVSADGSILYIGGSFSGFQSRSNLVALSTTTGIATSWNPNPAGSVNSIAVSGTRMYVGGTFSSTSGATTIGGQSRNFIAAISTATGLDDNSWVTLVNGIVNYVSVAGGNVYMGGEFTSAGGERRNRVAAIDYANDIILPWDPNANDIVMTLIDYKGSIYAGGYFTNIGGQTKQRMAALNKTTGAAVPGWTADVNGIVRTLYAGNNSIYAGGDFTTIGGLGRNRIAKLHYADGTVNTLWNPNADNIVRAISGYQEKIYAGGDFDNAGGLSRSKIAALDSTNGAAIGSWYPAGGAAGTTSAVPSRVNALAVSGSTLYAGGSFATMGGQGKKNIAAIDNNGSVMMGFTANPSSANEVNVILPSGNYLYVGGSFNDMKADTRHQHLSEINPLTGDPSSTFFASPGAAVYTVAVHLFTMYFGGAFPNYIPELSYPVGRNSFLSFHTANGGMSVLASEAKNFSVQQQNDTRIIRWQAENAGQDVVYAVQRTAADMDFVTIDQQRAGNSSSYEARDYDQLTAGIYYYRLQITKGRKISYSAIRPIEIEAGSRYNVYPSVVTNGRFTVTAPAGNSVMYMYNVSGQRMGMYLLQAGLNSVSTNQLSKGLYQYTLTDRQGGNVYSGKIVVQ